MSIYWVTWFLRISNQKVIWLCGPGPGSLGCHQQDSWSCCLWRLAWAAGSTPNKAYTHVVGSRLHLHILWASHNTWSSLKNKWPRRRVTRQKTSTLFYDPGLEVTHKHLCCILLVTQTTSNATQEEMTYGVSIRRQRLSGASGRQAISVLHTYHLASAL